MTVLLLLDCMSFVRVGRMSILLPPTLLVSVIPFILVLTIASVRPSVCLLPRVSDAPTPFTVHSSRAIEPPRLFGSVKRVLYRQRPGFTFLDQSRGRLVRFSERSAMDQQARDGSQQSRPPVVQDKTLHDSLPPPPPPPVLTMPQASPYVLHGHSEVAPPIVVQTIVIDDAHARMDRIKQRMRQLRVSDGSVVWDDLEGMSVANLSAKFRMPDIEKYMGIGCPRIHLRLYSTVMRAHGLDKSQMITLFPLSLSGAAQRWRDLKALRQRTDELFHHSSPLGEGKLSRSLTGLQRGIDTDGSEEFTAQDCQTCSRDSSPSDVKWKKPFGGQRSVDYRSRAPHPTYDQTYIPQTLVWPYYAAQDIERPPVSYTATGQPCYAAQFFARPTSSHPRPRAQQASAPFA
ncbi:hypothetical protein CK203_064810 [Vitis vinifera]|uniref:Uncharacterized protein n=1 Tax=Vitis vinifera TaxID=29760 RepID=A0A438FY36_VITVI|nr:hypothetical protein CK203_064810 [Vitis vinifera]